MKILFIGNSATYVHEIPQTLAKLAKKLGHDVEAAQITPGGCELVKHADISCDHGQKVLDEINKGYDIVIFQDNGNCISSEEKRSACINACALLAERARKTGAKVMIYVRPPYGYEKFGYSPFEMCAEFDTLFTKIAKEENAQCVFVNRAFAYVIKNREYDPWGPDHAHTSELGAYLVVCTFFATIFGESATVLDICGIDDLVAKDLQNIADKIVLEKCIPW